MCEYIDYPSLRWQSDWCGDEVGYDDVLVVGLYSDDESGIDYYIDVENGCVLDAWFSEE